MPRRKRAISLRCAPCSADTRPRLFTGKEGGTINRSGGVILINDHNQPTIHEACQLLKTRQLSSVELTKSCLARIREVEPKLHALVTVTDDLALSQAQEADALIASGEAGPLTGVPVLIKDNMCTRGIHTTCSSKMLASFVPPYDASVVEKLNECQAVILGKANMDEFAMGSSTENSAFSPTCNPWELSRVPGGSSGGSAVGVASGEAIYALGSDTGGSIQLRMSPIVP